MYFSKMKTAMLCRVLSLMIKVKKDIFRGLKKITGGSSMGGGILIPLVKLVPMVTHLKQFSP